MRQDWRHNCKDSESPTDLATEQVGGRRQSMPAIPHCTRCGDRDLASEWCWTCEEEYEDYLKGGGALTPREWSEQ